MSEKFSHEHENTKAVINRLSRAIGHLESVKKSYYPCMTSPAYPIMVQDQYMIGQVHISKAFKKHFSGSLELSRGIGKSCSVCNQENILI